MSNRVESFDPGDFTALNRALTAQAEALNKAVRPAVDAALAMNNAVRPAMAAIAAQTDAVNRALAPFAKQQAAITAAASDAARVVASAALPSKTLTAFTDAFKPTADITRAFDLASWSGPSMPLLVEFKAQPFKLASDALATVLDGQHRLMAGIGSRLASVFPRLEERDEDLREWLTSRLPHLALAILHAPLPVLLWLRRTYCDHCSAPFNRTKRKRNRDESTRVWHHGVVTRFIGLTAPQTVPLRL